VRENHFLERPLELDHAFILQCLNLHRATIWDTIFSILKAFIPVQISN